MLYYIKLHLCLVRLKERVQTGEAQRVNPQ